ncbi:MAG TPA: DUF2442 domain-containing protein [Methylomirabilota bacterium]|nr:DUF2442 domain-containing protein [Methylomirabilota bacterium]
MKSARPGESILDVEVTNVSPHGFWLLIDAEERFLSFKIFPWFLEASIAQLTNVKRPSRHHLYWPDLDVDLAVESIEHPERYPLVSEQRAGKRQRSTTTVKESVRKYRAGKPGRRA